MSVIVIDGPEKSGKSTLANALKEKLASFTDEIDIVHWVGRADPDDSIYAQKLQEATTLHYSRYISIWDRSWVSEHVYGKLLSQPRRLVENPWLGEWLHGRAAQANGVRVILTAPLAKLIHRRDSTDLPVSPELEVQLYKWYAAKFRWSLFEAKSDSLEEVDKIASSIETIFKVDVNGYSQIPTSLPPYYAGPVHADIIFVGEPSDHNAPDFWLPFNGRYQLPFAQLLDADAFRAGWVIAHECQPQVLREARVLVACGRLAAKWVHNYVTLGGETGQKVVELPSPMSLFSGIDSDLRREQAIQQIKQLMKEH